MKKIGQGVLVFAFWVVVWEIAARLLNLDFVFPSFFQTVPVFFSLLFSIAFWKTVAYSFGRILLGFFFGTFFGIATAALSVRVPVFRVIFAPAVSAIRSTPVASVIMILWVIFGSAGVPTAVALLMVAPLVYQSLIDGWQALNPEQKEVLRVFRVPAATQLRIFFLPSLWQYLSPALRSALGLAWKAGIAAETIAYTKRSIGKEIADARYVFDGALMFAWTLAVVLLSIGAEKLLIYFSERRNRRAGNQKSA